jgi:hypothetical protein
VNIVSFPKNDSERVLHKGAPRHSAGKGIRNFQLNPLSQLSQSRYSIPQHNCFVFELTNIVAFVALREV